MRTSSLRRERSCVTLAIEQIAQTFSQYKRQARIIYYYSMPTNLATTLLIAVLYIRADLLPALEQQDSILLRGWCQAQEVASSEDHGPAPGWAADH